MGFRTVRKDRLARSVHIVENEWWMKIETTGDLSPLDMLRSLRNAYARGEDVVVPGSTESNSLQWMNAYFIGDEEIPVM